MSTYKDLLFLQGYMGTASAEAERQSTALEARVPAASERPRRERPSPLRVVLGGEASGAGGSC
jgi:hypothetical protein